MTGVHPQLQQVPKTNLETALPHWAATEKQYYFSDFTQKQNEGNALDSYKESHAIIIIFCYFIWNAESYCNLKLY